MVSREVGIGRHGKAGIYPRGSDKNLYRTQGVRLEGGQNSPRDIAPRVTRSIVCAFFLVVGAGVTGYSKPIAVNLDRPAKYSYSKEVISKLSIGAKPGEIGIKPGLAMGEYFGPEVLGLDWENNIYVDDGVNNRIQKFKSDGKFEQVIFVCPPKHSCARKPQIDAQGRIFITVATPGRQKIDQIWQIRNGKIINRYPVAKAPRMEAPLAGARDVKISRSTYTVTVSFARTHDSRLCEIVFRSEKPIAHFDAATSATIKKNLFFHLSINGAPFVYQQDIHELSGRLIRHPHVQMFPNDGTVWVTTEVADGGDFYALHYGDSALDAQDYFAELIRVRPVRVDE